jgi:hypothetical protein
LVLVSQIGLLIKFTYIYDTIAIQQALSLLLNLIRVKNINSQNNLYNSNSTLESLNNSVSSEDDNLKISYMLVE